MSPSMYSLPEYEEAPSYDNPPTQAVGQGTQHADLQNAENDVELEDQEDTYQEEHDNYY